MGEVRAARISSEMEQHTMVQHRVDSRAGDGPWMCGLSLADFEIPSKPTPVAEVARVLTSVTLDLADAIVRDTLSDETPLVLDADTEAESPDDALDAASVVGWVESGEDLDFQDRKVLWPALSAAAYRPASSVSKRIEDNIAAIRLAQELGSAKRTPTAEEMAQLLRYSGWGGAARVFAPDGSKAHALAQQRDTLQSLVTAEAFTAMQASVNTAFFTPPELVQSLWRLVEHLGFEGGRVIEPSAGVGHFFASMPAHLARKSNLTAVEIDPTSAQILETAFAPFGVQVHACALEKAKNLPFGFWDLAIGNAPFGNFRTNDTSKSPYADWLIHNWFIARSIELVRPGGLVVLITSRGTLDSQTDAHRQWLAAHADFLGAYRLPAVAFEKHAKTEAVTDVIVLRRREMPLFGTNPQWARAEHAKQILFAEGETASKYTYHRQTGRSYEAHETVNAHYNSHPEAMLGRLKWGMGPHGDEALPQFDGDVDALCRRLDELVDQLPEDVYTPAAADGLPQIEQPMARYVNYEQALPGAFVVSEGRICVSEGDELLDVDALYAGTARKRLLGMIEVRASAVAVIEHQAKSEDDVELKRLQAHLNGTYDQFVGQYGPLSTTANARIMRSDPNWPLLLALEIWDEDTESVTKADIFSKRTVGVPDIPEHVDNVKDAMLISLALHGRIELRDMARRMDVAVRDVIEQMRTEGLAYRDPILNRWVPADEYLSGRIREKIEQAKAAGPTYEGNIPALEAVLPPDLGPLEVEARLGAPWIPCDVVKQFATELVNDTRDCIEVLFDESTATWSVKTTMYSMEYVGDRALQMMKWGTAARAALTLLENALNQQPPTVTKTVDNKSVVDAPATFAAREKWQAIRDEFRMWVYKDDARRDRLLRLYNDEFNQLVPRKYSGAHLHLPGMTTTVTLDPHQKDAVWRILVNGNTLLAHVVGGGKTFTMVAAGMELRRLGKARKVLHVTPNHRLEQYTAEAVRLYPQARVLMASKEDLTGDKRRAFVARIATGDWDAVVMTQSTFERLMLSVDLQRNFIDQQLDEARTMLALTDDRGAKRSIKEIEKRMKEYEAKITRLVESGKADDQSAVWFDELGVDWLMYDEAHAAKNLGRMSKMPRIPGLPNVSSQRAFDLFMKTRLIMQARGNKEEGVVFATATPISNSLADLWVNQIFLQPVTLKRYGLYEFDAWSASFGEAVTGIELAPDGSGYRTNTRYARFVNLAELMNIFGGVADIRTKAMLNLPTPRIEGGKPQVMVAEPSDTLKGIVAELVKRADAIRNRKVKPEEDNMLAITNDGRRAAIDVRLIDPALPADPDGKLMQAARNIHRIWLAGAAERHTQLVFCDLGTPAAEGFSVYRELRDQLVYLGVPLAEIAFIQDYDSDTAKAKLFKKVREGIVRVVMGSTLKMGTGTNVQKRLKAVHQICCPWRPCDVEQRDGRADRQGNECESIELWRYVTSGSFDAYSWNLIDVKAKFIEQVMTAHRGVRTVEDISMTALSYAELKAIASGNPLVLEKAAVDARVQKLALLFDQWEDERWRMSSRKASVQQRITWITSSMPAVEADAKAAAATNAQSVFNPLSAIGIGAAQMAGSTPEAVGTAFRAAAKAHQSQPFGEINGFTLNVVPRFLSPADLEVTAPNSGLRAVVDRPSMNDPIGVGRAVLATIAGIANDPGKLREEFGRKTEELASIDNLLAQDFEHHEELTKARARQTEIEAMLDLDKSTDGSQAMEAETA
jgi:N12 class adenine-specific DNA methylase